MLKVINIMIFICFFVFSTTFERYHIIPFSIIKNMIEMVPSRKIINSFSYRPDIDGLRAISIAIVTIFHLNLNCLPTGRIGVDVFFVISGYLITSILLKEHSKGTYSLKQFYVRRAKRIFPVLFISLTVFLAVVFIFFKEGVKYMAEHVIGSLLMALNFWRLRN